MAEAARTRARPGVRERTHGAHLAARADVVRGVARRAGPDLLPVPDLLDLPDVVPDERGHPAHPAEPVLHADAVELPGADHRQAASRPPARSTSPSCSNLWNSVLLSTVSVAIALLLGVPAAYAFARFKFRLGEDIAFTLLSFRFAPPLLVLLPLSLYFQQLGLTDTYVGLIWVYQLIALPLILWIVRGYFEDISPGHRARLSHRRPFLVAHLHPHRRAARRAGHRGGGAARLHLLLEQFRLRADPRLGRQAAGDRRLRSPSSPRPASNTARSPPRSCSRSRRPCCSRSMPSAISSRACRSAR